MSTGEVITAIVGSGGVLTVIGAGAKFIWNKIEARFERIEKELAECRKREVASMAREADSRERRAMQITVIELLWAKVKEMDPAAAVLDRAKHILDELKQMAAKDAD
jgi:hypothetical protein